MSHSESLRVVNTELQRNALQVELRRSRVDEIQGLLRMTIDDLPSLAAVLGDATCLADVRSALVTLPAAVPLSSIDLLSAELSSLERQALAAGISADEVAPLAAQLDDLRARAAALPAVELEAAADAAFAAAEDLEALVVDAVSDAQATRLAIEAAAATLAQMGLDVRVKETADGVAISGTNAVGQWGEVSFDGHPPTAEVLFEDPEDAVHPLHPAAADPCRAAIALAYRFHTVFETEMVARGLQVGRVEARTRPTRGPSLKQRRQPPAPPRMRAAQ